MVRSKRRVQVALATMLPVLVLLLVPAPAAAKDAGAAGATLAPGVVCFWDGEHLVVVNRNEGLIRAYEVSGSGISIAGVKGLNEAPAPRSKPVETLPSRDVPGEDPPGFTRPAGAVRVAASMEQDQGQREWEATYLITGEFEDLYTSLVESLQGWTIRTAEASRDPDRSYFGATLEAERGDNVLRINLRGRPEEPRRLKLDVSLKRELD